MLSYNHIFDNIVSTDKIKGGNERDLKRNFATLEFQMKRKLLVEDTEVDDCVFEKESAHAMKNKSWKMMDMCFKWKHILDYVSSLDRIDPEMTLVKIKELFMGNKLLTIVYDTKSKCISKLNIKMDDGEVI